MERLDFTKTYHSRRFIALLVSKFLLISFMIILKHVVLYTSKKTTTVKLNTYHANAKIDKRKDRTKKFGMDRRYKSN